jgi:hypothetical protein
MHRGNRLFLSRRDGLYFSAGIADSMGCCVWRGIAYTFGDHSRTHFCIFVFVPGSMLMATSTA